jgi:hypothetical protein
MIASVVSSNTPGTHLAQPCQTSAAPTARFLIGALVRGGDDLYPSRCPFGPMKFNVPPTPAPSILHISGAENHTSTFKGPDCRDIGAHARRRSERFPGPPALCSCAACWDVEPFTWTVTACPPPPLRQYLRIVQRSGSKPATDVFMSRTPPGWWRHLMSGRQRHVDKTEDRAGSCYSTRPCSWPTPCIPGGDFCPLVAYALPAMATLTSRRRIRSFPVVGLDQGQANRSD